PLEPEAESLEPAPVLGAGAPVGGVPPGAVPWGGVAPCGGGPPDGRRACIAARTFVADRPSCFASAVAGSAFALGAWPGVPAGRALAIAARSFDSETPSFVASAARSKPPGPGCAWAPPADDRLEPAVPDCALLCVLAAPPQPAAPSAAEAPTMTTSLWTFGFMGTPSRRDGRQGAACQKTWSARSLG